SLPNFNEFEKAIKQADRVIQTEKLNLEDAPFGEKYDVLKKLLQAELTEVLANTLKTLKLGTFRFCLFTIFVPSFCFALSLFVMCLIYFLGGSLKGAALAGLILGGSSMMGTIFLFRLILKEEFWISTFKLDKAVQHLS